MLLSEFKRKLEEIQELVFQLPDGSLVPNHFHVTEVGQISKHFIDCGGTVRTEVKVGFQLWQADDYDHRLAPQKLKNIIQLSENKLLLKDAEIEVEYQGNTINKYHLDFDGKVFLLTTTATACLAEDQCGIPVKKKIKLTDLGTTDQNCCSPDSKCC